MKYLLLVLFLFSSCEKCDHKLVLLNNAPLAIYYLISDSSEEYALKIYSLQRINSDTNDAGGSYLQAFGKSEETIIGSWKNFFNSGFSDGKAIIYWIDSINIGKDIIEMKKKKLLKQIEISNDYLEQHNWQLTLQ